jgi:hypothetical protein
MKNYDMEAYLNLVAYFKPHVFIHVGLEPLGQPYVMPDVLLQTGNSVVTYYEPEFKRAKSSAEWNTPVSVVDGCVGISVLHMCK